jgi:ATP-binding cassette subfamily F protein uup
MAPPLLHIDSVSLTFGGTPLLESATLSAAAGDRIALVGRNGSGKSTLLRIAAGLVEPQSGEVFRSPSATIRYLPQVPDFGEFATVEAYVESGLGPANDLHRAAYLIDHLGLDGQARPATLSGGEARRAALAKTLAPEPDILLLDEPTNHLDLTTIEWLERELARRSSAIVVISHDRRFLENVSRATVWLDRGSTKRLEQGFGHFEEWRDKILEEEERDLHKLGREIVREEHWLRYGVTARRKRNMRRLKELNEKRAEFRNFRRAEGKAKMEASDARLSGKMVIEAEGLCKSYESRQIVRDFSIRILRGDRVGIVGPNGAGKTTLVSLLTGALQPDSGHIRFGANLETAVLDQKRARLDTDDTVTGFLTGGRGDQISVNGQARHVVSYMKDFLFKPEQLRTPIATLSGGERARLLLAEILARPANFLVLDEPTNDLDMETLDLLEGVIDDYPGTVILVSHDRDFLDRTVTSTLAPEGDGRWTEYAGGYTDMLAQRGEKALGQPSGGKSKREGTARTGGNRSRDNAATKPSASSRKLSYKQKFALETLPGRIEFAQSAIAALEAKIADPALFSNEPAAFHRFADELAKKRNELSSMEEEWLELEMLREEIEG